MHYILDQVVENNRTQEIGSNENYDDQTENFDYKMETGVECRCGTELTVPDDEMDYIVGGRSVRIVSFIKWLLSPLINLWTRQEDYDHHNKKDRPFKTKFNFLSKAEFRPKHGLNPNSFQEKLKPYKPRYVFQTKHDNSFSQRVWRK